MQGVQRRPYLQWTAAVVDEQAERKSDAWIFSRLLQEMGLPSLLDIPGGDMMTALWDGRLGETGNSIAALRESDDHVVILPEAEHGGFLARVSGGKNFNACPEPIKGTFSRAVEVFDDLLGESGETLKFGLSKLEGVARCEGGGHKSPLHESPGCPAAWAV